MISLISENLDLIISKAFIIKGKTISRIEPAKEQQILFAVIELRQFGYIRTEFGDVDPVWYYPGVYFEKWAKGFYAAS